MKKCVLLCSSQCKWRKGSSALCVVRGFLVEGTPPHPGAQQMLRGEGALVERAPGPLLPVAPDALGLSYGAQSSPRVSCLGSKALRTRSSLPDGPGWLDELQNW